MARRSNRRRRPTTRVARPEKTTTTDTKTDVIAGKAVPKPAPSEMVVAEPKAGTLRSDYVTTLDRAGMPATSFELVADRSQVERRSNALMAKLAAIGVTDVSQEGKLVLSGPTRLPTGVRRGVDMKARPELDTATRLDLDTVPELRTYTLDGPPTTVTADPDPQVVKRTADAPSAKTASAPAAGTGSVRTTQPVTRTTQPVTRTTQPVTRAAQPVTTTTTTRTRKTRPPADTTTLRMAPPPPLYVDEAIIVAEELQLQNGTELIIEKDVKYLTILAQRFTVGVNCKITWVADPAADRDPQPAAPQPSSDYNPTVQTAASDFTSPSGSDGADGRNGDKGYPGDHAPTVEIWSLDQNRMPNVDLQGDRGGRGQDGQDGGDGGDGAKGLKAHQAVFCTRGPGHGGDGGDAGDGGRGGDGGKGGTGGSLLLYTTDPSHDTVLEAGFLPNLAGGPGGYGGDGGEAGDAGRGGDEGDPAWPACTAEPDRAGRSGSAGEEGDDGDEGPQGHGGRLTAVVITPDEFRVKWTSPQIATVDPVQVEVGDTVTVEGANFTSGAQVSFDGVNGATTFIADTILQAQVPALPTGWADTVVNAGSSQPSNPFPVEVLPSLSSVSPSPSVLGATITLSGSGFDSDSRVLFRGVELVPDSVDSAGTTITVTLPAPDGPFEDLGGDETIAVRTGDGITSPSLTLPLRHVLSTGFDVGRNGFAFLNANLNAVAGLGTFERTYGLAEVSANWVLSPVLTTAWYAYYLHFFNNMRPGYSSGFSMVAADEYWSGNPDLFGDHAALPEVEDTLCVAQGHILSQEMLGRLLAQAAAGVGRAETSLQEVEAAFRRQITADETTAREIAPVMQLLPAGTILTSGFIRNLSVSHGLLPIRSEFPMPGETFERRLVLYDNAAQGGVGAESFAEFTRNGDVLDFEIHHLTTGGSLAGTDARDSRSGFTLSHLPLGDCWLSDVDMPVDLVFIFSPVTLVIEDAEGRKFGTDGDQVWNDLPNAGPAIGAPGLFLVGLDRDVDIHIHGTGDGTYTLGAVGGSVGASIALTDVPVTRKTRDRLSIRKDIRDLAFTTGDGDKPVGVSYGIRGRNGERAVKIDKLRAAKGRTLALRAATNLRNFALEGAGTDTIAAELARHGPDGVQQAEFPKVAVPGGSRTFEIPDWDALGKDSLADG